MFSDVNNAPLYAEQFLGGETDQHQLPEGQDDCPYATRSPPRADFGRSPKSSPSPTPQVEQQQHYRGEGTGGHDESPTITETSSDEFSPCAMEAGFEDEIHVRKLPPSGSSNPASARRSSTNSGDGLRHSESRSSIDSSSGLTNRDQSEMCSSIDSLPQQRQQQQQQHQQSVEIAKKDQQLQKLMKQLDAMQRRVIDLEVDRQCHDLRFAKYTETEFSLQNLGDVDPVDIEIGGPPPGSSGSSSSSSSSNLSDAEKQHDISPVKRTQPRIGPDAKRLIYELMNDYEDMERMYKEEKFKNSRQTLSDMDASSERESSPVFDSSFATETAWDPHASLGIFQSKLENDMQSFGVMSTRQLGSVAPDPPEVDMSQRESGHSNFRALGQSEEDLKDIDNGDGDDDHRSDDLSSRAIDSLIDEGVRSDCNAVKDHKADSRQYWRDIILGVNDGLVSTFLLVAGVRGGGMTSTDILLTAIAGAVAGAVSMCAGEYVATKSQNEVIHGEIAIEERHVRDHRRDELSEVSHLLALIGIGDEDRALQKRLIRHYARNDQALLKIMIALELGCLEDEERSPLMAGFVSFFLFLVGAAPSVVPFMIPGIDATAGFIAAGVATCVTLLIVGAVKTWATKGNCLVAATENLCIAGFGGAVAFGAGALVQMFVEG